MAKDSRNDRRVKRHERVRKNLYGTPEKPRLCVYRSNKNISAQIIDDVNGTTLVAASSLDKDLKAEVANGGNKEAAKKVGAALAKSCGKGYRRSLLRQRRILVPRKSRRTGSRRSRRRIKILTGGNKECVISLMHPSWT